MRHTPAYQIHVHFTIAIPNREDNPQHGGTILHMAMLVVSFYPIGILMFSTAVLPSLSTQGMVQFHHEATHQN
jgi:hypothetical protein